MKSKLEVYKDSKGEWRWRLKASNGRVVATSGEGFKRKRSCTDSWNSVHNTFWAGRFDIVEVN